MYEHEVKDGSRTLQFNGRKLGNSTSWRPGSHRWIEFELYRTDNGSYILSRIGVSLIYHAAACPLVRRYGLQDMSVTELQVDAVACEDCQPTFEAQLIFPEKYRYWALVTEEPSAILNALYKEDYNGGKYLTRVAERLLDGASSLDPEIESVYKLQIIP